MNRLYFVLIVLCVTACAAPMQRHKTDNSTTQAQFDPYAECVLPTVRDAGRGVKVEGCHAWTFGPSKTQQAAFRGRK